MMAITTRSSISVNADRLEEECTPMKAHPQAAGSNWRRISGAFYRRPLHRQGQGTWICNQPLPSSLASSISTGTNDKRQTTRDDVHFTSPFSRSSLIMDDHSQFPCAPAVQSPGFSRTPVRANVECLLPCPRALAPGYSQSSRWGILGALILLLQNPLQIAYVV